MSTVGREEQSIEELEGFRVRFVSGASRRD